MIQEDEKTGLGAIKIHNNVISSIAYIAALEIEGVARVCDNLKSTAMRFLKKDLKGSAIDVRPEKDEGVTIIIPIIVKYGYNIPEVALQVQEKIKTAIEETTDLLPRDIIVKIKGVEK